MPGGGLKMEKDRVYGCGLVYLERWDVCLVVV
jgi:hypothetical protein